MNEQRSIAEQHAQWCVHYRSPYHNKTCKAGVDYDVLVQREKLGDTGSALRKPCIRGNHQEESRRGQPLFVCPLLQWPTGEQCLEAEQESEAAIARLVLAVPIIERVKVDHRGVDWKGVMGCPACDGGSLTLTHAALNGHVSGKCSTEGCLSWME